MIVSCCVIAYNEEKALPSLLTDFVAQDYPHEKMEIILVDGVSQDETKKIMGEFAITNQGFKRVAIVENRKRIQAPGWNIAIRESRGDIIIRIDAHASIPSDFVSKNVAIIERGEDVVGGARPNIAFEDTPQQRIFLAAERAIFGSGIAGYRQKTKKEKYVNSVFHGAYRREVFEKAGLFNEKLGRTEDNEMHYRIRKAGYKICYSPEIVSYQHVRSTWKGMVKQKYANGYWVALTLGICPQCLAAYHFVPLLFVLVLFAALGVFFITGNMWVLLGIIMAYGVGSVGMTLLSIKDDKKMWQQILIPFIFLSMHLSYGIGTLIGLVKMPLWRQRNKGSN